MASLFAYTQMLSSLFQVILRSNCETPENNNIKLSERNIEIGSDLHTMNTRLIQSKVIRIGHNTT